MADARDNKQEAEKRSDETGSRSIQEPKENETNQVGRMNQSRGPLKKRRYLQQEKLRDVETETKGPTPVMGLSVLGRRSDERTDSTHKTESKSLPEKTDKEGSVLRINEACQIRDYNHSNTDTRDVLQQKTPPRDVEMQGIPPETESRFWHQERDRSPDWRESESRWRFDERTPDWRESESRWRFDERTQDWWESESRWRSDERAQDWSESESSFRVDERTQDWRGSESRMRYDQDWRGSESEWMSDDRRHEPVRPGEQCGCRRCRNGRSCYNHPTQIRQERPVVRVSVPICKYSLSGYCKLGSNCGFKHVNDREGAEPMYQASSTDWGESESEWRFDETPQRRYEIDSYELPEKRAKTILDTRERDSREIFEDLEEGEIQEQENPQEQIQSSSETQGTETQDQHNLQSRIDPDPRMHDPRPDPRMRDPRLDPRMRDPRRHDTERRFERERMEQRSTAEVKYSSHLIDAIVSGIMQRRAAQEREQRQIDSIERQRREAQENLQQQGLQEMPENQNVDAHNQQNMRELGFKRKEGDGV